MGLCVALCVEPVPEVEGEREKKKKKKLLESLGKQKFRLEKNDKERLKNNILIKIRF